MTSWVLVVLVPILVWTGAATNLAAWAVGDRRRLQAAYTEELSRNRELFTLLEARAAPIEYSAYLHPTPKPEQQTWLHSADGLISIPLDTEDESWPPTR